VLLLEREALLATHSSARNAQIWLPVEEGSTAELARQSAAGFTALLGDEARWLRRDGALIVTEPPAVNAFREGARAGGVEATDADRTVLARLAPELTPGDRPALWIAGAGVFEPSVMMDALARSARDRGAVLRTGAGVAAVRVEAGRVAGVVLDDGSALDADEVVLAAGAWAGALGAAVGAPTTLVPLRRHLVMLDAPRPSKAIVWCFLEGDGQVYWRPESGGILASPCEEVPVAPSLPAADPAALESLARRLGPVAPSLVDAPVRTSWACLRTYTADRELVLGPDPRVPGLSWLAGLGGRGMTIGLAAGERLARALREGDPVEGMRPDRQEPT